MKHTTEPSLTGFASPNGWNLCLNNAYTIPDTGWQTNYLTTPFYWDGINNLIIKVCYNSSVYSLFPTPVKASYEPDIMMAAYHQSIPGGNGCSDPWVADLFNYRPLICLTINPFSQGTVINSNTTPFSYSLFQNYPNPFNPTTKIKFDIQKQSFVKMHIFDILGREVSKPVEEIKLPGSYIVDFDGSNLSSGIYFCKLTVKDPAGRKIIFSSIKKMLLVK
jgi:hypothetical protein